MCEGMLCEAVACGGNPCSGEGLVLVGKALHDLCQPLTTLQCRLELAGVIGSDEAYREAVDLALVECERVVQSVGALRELVRAARS